MRIAIVGAGPAGIACAWQLAKNNHDVTLFEKKHDHSSQGSGVLLQPVGLAALEAMGIRDEIEALGHKIHEIDGTSLPSKRQLLNVDYRVLTNIKYALGINRTALWNCLFEHAVKYNIDIINNVTISTIKKELNNTITIIDDNGKYYQRFELIIDASGAYSKLHKHARHVIQRKVLKYGSLWAKVPLPNNSPFNENKMIVNSDHHNLGIGIMPIGKENPQSQKMATLFFNLSWRDCPIWDDNSFIHWRKEMIEKWPDAAHLIKKITNHKQLYLAKFCQYTLPIPYGEKIVFIGDAAHSAPPQLGLGINISLIDALTLPWAINQKEDLEDGLKLYAKKRLKHVIFYQTFARFMTPFYQADTPYIISIRDLIYNFINQQFMMKNITAFLISGQLFCSIKKLKRLSNKDSQTT